MRNCHIALKGLERIIQEFPFWLGYRKHQEGLQEGSKEYLWTFVVIWVVLCWFEMAHGICVIEQNGKYEIQPRESL